MTQGRRWCVFARKAVWNRPASTENESKALVGGKEARAVRGDATIRAHKSGMNRAANSLKLAFLCLAVLSLSSCAGGRTVGEHIADMPPWMGGCRQMHRRAAARLNTMSSWRSGPRKRRGRRLSSSLSRRYLSSSG
jgi:hypothetical protein